MIINNTLLFNKITIRIILKEKKIKVRKECS